MPSDVCGAYQFSCPRESPLVAASVQRRIVKVRRPPPIKGFAGKRISAEQKLQKHRKTARNQAAANYTEKLGLFRTARAPLMKRVSRFACLAALLLTFSGTASTAHGQQPRRQFAPGVLTTIPPAPEAEEMFSGPSPLVEL